MKITDDWQKGSLLGITNCWLCITDQFYIIVMDQEEAEHADAFHRNHNYSSLQVNGPIGFDFHDCCIQN